jgi:hypothetical protein
MATKHSITYEGELFVETRLWSIEMTLILLPSNSGYLRLLCLIFETSCKQQQQQPQGVLGHTLDSIHLLPTLCFRFSLQPLEPEMQRATPANSETKLFLMLLIFRVLFQLICLLGLICEGIETGCMPCLLVFFVNFIVCSKVFLEYHHNLHCPLEAVRMATV